MRPLASRVERIEAIVSNKPVPKWDWRRGILSLRNAIGAAVFDHLMNRICALHQTAYNRYGLNYDAGIDDVRRFDPELAEEIASTWHAVSQSDGFEAWRANGEGQTMDLAAIYAGGY